MSPPNPKHKQRLYQPVWEKLKADKKVSLSVPESLQPRVIKAIQKEKYNDVGYKFLLSENNESAELEFHTHGARVQVILKITKHLTISDII